MRKEDTNITWAEVARKKKALPQSARPVERGPQRKEKQQGSNENPKPKERVQRTRKTAAIIIEGSNEDQIKFLKEAKSKINIKKLSIKHVNIRKGRGYGY